MSRAARRAAVFALPLALTQALGGCSQGEDPERHVEYAVQGAYTAAISPDGHYGLIGSIQHGGSLWDLDQHERLYNWNHRADSYSSLVAADFSPGGAYAVTAEQQNLVLWQVDSGRAQAFWTAPAGIQAVALAPAGSFALLGLNNHTAVYFDIKHGGIKQSLYHDGIVRSVALSDDGTLALTGADDNLARLWHLERGEVLQIQHHGNSVNTVALSPSGAYAFSAGQLDRGIIWDTASGRLLHTLSGPETFASRRLSYTAAVFSPTSDRLLTGTSAGLIQLWDVASGEELRRWQAHKRNPFRPTAATIYGLAFTGSDRYYALASNGFINVLK